MLHLGEILRKLRRERDIKQTYMALRLGVSPSYYSRLEKESDMRVSLLLQCAGILKVRPELFIYYNENEIKAFQFHNNNHSHDDSEFQMLEKNLDNVTQKNRRLRSKRFSKKM